MKSCHWGKRNLFAAICIVILALISVASPLQMSSQLAAEEKSLFRIAERNESSARPSNADAPSVMANAEFGFDESSSPPRHSATPLASNPAFTSHAPIQITGDADFLIQNASDPFCWAGTGSAGDPYIIEGLNITLPPGATAPAISISDMTIYFILRESFLAGSHQYQIGLLLENVTHATIADNSIQNFFSGIQLSANCTNNVLTRNSVFNSTTYGIIIEEGSEYNNVTWNSFLHNNQGGSQAWARGKWNLFDYNHWNDHVSPDADSDGIVEDHYVVGERSVLAFDGTNDQVAIPHDPSLDLGIAMTIELWARPPAVNPSNYDRLVGKGGSTLRNYGVWIIMTGNPSGRTSGAILFQIDSTAGYQEVVGTMVVADGNWHHIAATYNGSMMALYIDGKLDDSFASTETPYINTDDLILGYQVDHGHYQGVLGEVRILNQSLTPAEIQADYAAKRHFPVRSGTVAWYLLNEAGGTTVTDSSGNTNHGTISGAGWQSDRGANPALAFWGSEDSGGYVNATDFDLNHNFTVEFWMAPSSITQSAYLIAKNFPTVENRFLIGVTTGSEYNIVFNQAESYTTPPGVTWGWQHLAVVAIANGTHTNITLYKNGTYLADYTFGSVLGDVTGGKLWSFAQEWDISPTRTTNHYTGWLDEIRFLNRSLTPIEIQEDYASGFHYPVRSNTTAWYHFDENSIPAVGATVIDSSGNGNDGVVANDAGWGSPPMYVGTGSLIDRHPRIQPIWINDDADFANFSVSGDGTENTPFVLAGYYFTSDATKLISICNTTAYFVLCNSSLNGMTQSYVAIQLENVTHGTIATNTIQASKQGIHLLNSCANNSILGNTILYTDETGILVEGASGNNTVANNTIRSTATFHGISLGSGCDNNTLTRNTIAQVEWHGIAVYQAQSNNITGNTISECKADGIALYDTCNGNNVANNRISDCESDGIDIGLKSDRNNISRNMVFNSVSWGLTLDSTSDQNHITWNWFFHNNGSGIQANDDGGGNIFAHNHWNDWLTPDGDIDGVVDSAYTIEGENPALNFDGNDDRVDTTDFALAENFTIELWMNPDYPTPLSGDEYLVAKNNVTADNQNFFLLGVQASTGSFIIYLDNAAQATSGVAASAGWQHLAVVGISNTTDTNVTLYKNGTKAWSSLWVDHVLKYRTGLAGGRPWSFGQEYDSVLPSQWFDGQLDEIRFVNRSLAAIEIQEDYAGGLGYYPARNNTVAWYHFNEDTGAAVADSSGNGNDGTITGATWTAGPPIPKQDIYPRVAPIWINDDSDFGDFATGGTGTSGDPFVLGGHYFISNQSALIIIANTSAYFRLQDFSLDGNPEAVPGYPAITLTNVKNGVIATNIIKDCSEGIILSTYCINNSLTANSISNCPEGIALNDNCANNSLLANSISNCNKGIYILKSENNTLSGNIILDALNHGIELRGAASTNCSGNLLLNNVISNPSLYGIYLSLFCFANNLTRNTITDANDGMRFYSDSSQNIVAENTILRSQNYGVALQSDSSHNALYYNTIANSTNDGLYFDFGCDDNAAICNYFWDNKQGSPQIYDAGTSNNITHNYFNDHVAPDDDSDGLVDTPYFIMGGANNYDPFPQVYPYDIIAPVITLVSPTNLAYVPSTTLVQFTVTDNYLLEPVNVSYNWDGGASNTASPPYSLSCPSSEMYHTVQIYAEDLAGNLATASFSYTIDDTAPTITLASAAQGTIGQSGAPITLNVSDANPIAFVLYYWDNATLNSTLMTPYALNFSSTEGSHILHVFAQDQAGHWGTYNETFITDDTPPTAIITGLEDQMTVVGELNVTVTPQDANGIARVEFLADSNSSLNATAPPYTWIWDSTTVADGERTLVIRVYDRAGNLLEESFAVKVANEEEEEDLQQLIIIVGGAIIVITVAGGGGASFLIIRRRRGK